MRTRVAILFSVFMSFGAVQAAEVLRVGKDMTNIAVSHDDTRKWVPRDRVCVLQRAREIACGVVTKATTKGAIVHLDNPSNDVIAGDKVISKFSSAPAASPASAPLMNSVPDGESGVYNFNLSAGVAVGTSFFYPTLAVQFAVAPTISIGAGGFFFSYPGAGSTSTLTAFGGYATVSYYSQEYFRGLWIQAAGGMGSFMVSDTFLPTETAASFIGFATVGWRGYWDLGFNIGVGGGLQYISTPQFSNFITNSAGLLPLVVVDVGISF